MNLKDFKEFLSLGIVKKQTINRERALSIIKEVGNKKQFLEISIKTISEENMNHNFIVEQCYDIIMELIRAKMFLDGYNAGNSHEAEVSYLFKLKFHESDIIFMNELRYYRNGTKYYGTILKMDYARKVITFMEKIYPKLMALFK